MQTDKSLLLDKKMSYWKDIGYSYRQIALLAGISHIRVMYRIKRYRKKNN